MIISCYPLLSTIPLSGISSHWWMGIADNFSQKTDFPLGIIMHHPFLSKTGHMNTRWWCTWWWRNHQLSRKFSPINPFYLSSQEASAPWTRERLNSDRHRQTDSWNYSKKVNQSPSPLLWPCDDTLAVEEIISGLLISMQWSSRPNLERAKVRKKT